MPFTLYSDFQSHPQHFGQDIHMGLADTTQEDTPEPRWDDLTFQKAHQIPTLGQSSETTPVPLAGGTGLHSPAWDELSYPHSSEAECLNLEPVPSLDLHSVNV